MGAIPCLNIYLLTHIWNQHCPLLSSFVFIPCCYSKALNKFKFSKDKGKNKVRLKLH